MKIREVIKKCGIVGLFVGILATEAQKIYCPVCGKYFDARNNSSEPESCPVCFSKYDYWCSECREFKKTPVCPKHPDSFPIPDSATLFYHKGCKDASSYARDGDSETQKKNVEQMKVMFEENITTLPEAQVALRAWEIYRYYMFNQYFCTAKSGDDGTFSFSGALWFQSPDLFFCNLEKFFSPQFVEMCRSFGWFRQIWQLNSVTTNLIARIKTLGFRFNSSDSSLYDTRGVPTEVKNGPLFRYLPLEDNGSDKSKLENTCTISDLTVTSEQTLDMLAMTDPTFCISGNPQEFNLPQDCWENSITIPVSEIIVRYPNLANATINDLRTNPEFDPNRPLKNFKEMEYTLQELFETYDLNPHLSLFGNNSPFLNMSLQEFIRQYPELSSSSLYELSLQGIPMSTPLKYFIDYTGTLADLFESFGLSLKPCIDDRLGNKTIVEIIQNHPFFAVKNLNYFKDDTDDLTDEERGNIQEIMDGIGKVLHTIQEAQVFASALTIYAYFYLNLNEEEMKILLNDSLSSNNHYELEGCLKILQRMTDSFSVSPEVQLLTQELGHISGLTGFTLVLDTFQDFLKEKNIKVVSYWMYKVLNLDGTFKANKNAICFILGSCKDIERYYWGADASTMCAEIRYWVSDELSAKYALYIFAKNQMIPGADVEYLKKQYKEQMQPSGKLLREIEEIGNKKLVAGMSRAIDSRLSKIKFSEEGKGKILKVFRKDLSKLGLTIKEGDHGPEIVSLP